MTLEDVPVYLFYAHRPPWTGMLRVFPNGFVGASLIGAKHSKQAMDEAFARFSYELRSALRNSTQEIESR